MGSPLQRRLAKELQQLASEPPTGVRLSTDAAPNLKTLVLCNIYKNITISSWSVEVDGAPSTIYAGENFQLQFSFSDQYPFTSPEVIFTGENIPVHPHVYSNGHICLSILTDDWTPALSVQAVCLSIVSMLSSCKEKVS
jgi:ubiquitin-conjugating enzyme E2 W